MVPKETNITIQTQEPAIPYTQHTPRKQLNTETNIMVALAYRRATVGDAPRLCELMEHAFTTNDSRPDWTGDAEIASHFRMKLENMVKGLEMEDVVTFAISDATDEKGYIIASVNLQLQGENKDVARISSIIVQDEYQRGGIGSQILAYAEDYSKKTWSVDKFSLDALSSRTALLAWYKRKGYRETGETRPFPRKMFHMCTIPDDLCFIQMIKDPEAESAAAVAH